MLGPMTGATRDFAARIAADEAGLRARFFAKLKRVLGVVPFAAEALSAFYCATDRATPAWVKATLVAALAYFIAPADSIPDFIAALGYTDDAAVLLGAVKAVSAHIRPEHRARAEAFLKGAG